jgi:hypothetical protein
MGPVGERALEELRCRFGHDDLTAVGAGQEMREPIERPAEIIAVAGFDRADVDAHAHANAVNRRPVFGCERTLRVICGGNGVAGGGKRGANRVADHLENVSVPACDHRAH